MLPNLFKSYQADREAWDWKLIAIITAFARAHPDVFVMMIILGSALIVAVAILLAIIWFAEHLASYLWQLNGSLERTTPRNARILQGLIIAFVVLIGCSTLLYRDETIGWAIYSNTIGFGLLLFAIPVAYMDMQVRRHGATQPVPQAVTPGKSLNFRNLLRRNRKQPTNRP